MGKQDGREEALEEILFGVSLAYVAMARALIDAGSLTPAALIESLETMRDAVADRKPATASSWLSEAIDAVRNLDRNRGGHG